MATLEQLQARRETLQKIRDSGVLSSRHGDVSNVFRSLKELDDVLARLDAEIEGFALETTPRVRIVRLLTRESW